LLAVALSPTAPSLAAEAYPMICKGGRPIQVEYHSAGEWQFLKIFFQKEDWSATHRPVRAGRCSWLDRPINSHEPSIIKMKFKNVYMETRMHADGTINNIGYWTRENNREAQRHMQLLKYVMNAVQNGEIFQVTARHKDVDRGAYFEVTRIGP
jgi:hypothetical protein